MENELPEGWVETTLENIAEWGSGGTPNRSEKKYYDGDIPWVKTGDLNDGLLTEASEYITELGLKSSSAKLFPKGSIAIAMYGATIGKLSILGIDATTNQACGVAQVREGVSNKLLFYYLKSQKENFIEQGKGGAQPNISQTVLKLYLFPLPPLAEQTRIVAKLDAAFGHLETLKTSLARIPELLKKFRQTVLTQAVMGKLIGIRDFTTLGDMGVKIQTGPFGSSLHQEDYIENGTPVINPSHINNGELKPSQSVTIDNIKLAELQSFILEDNDVILGRRGEMGRAALYEKNLGLMICGTGSLVLRKSPNLSSKFLTYFLRSPFCVGFLTANSVGSTMINLNQSIIKSLPFPKISLDKQEEIVNKIETSLAQADALEAQYLSLKTKIDKLPQALLAKAFRGELVPQDPSDEPASVLLSTIKAATATIGKKKAKTGQTSLAFMAE